MQELLDADTFIHMKGLIENLQPLFEALSRHPYTLLHGDFRAENLAHPDRPVAFDWQEATCSLMTIDLAWFAKQGFVQAAIGQAQAIGLYRDCLEMYLNRRFDDPEWRAMVDLGYLVDALRSTCFSAYWYKHTHWSRTAKGRGPMCGASSNRNGMPLIWERSLACRSR